MRIRVPPQFMDTPSSLLLERDRSSRLLFPWLRHLCRKLMSSLVCTPSFHLSTPSPTQHFITQPLNYISLAPISRSFHKHRPNRRNNSCPRPRKLCFPQPRHPKDFCYPSPRNPLVNCASNNHRYRLGTYSVFG